MNRNQLHTARLTTVCWTVFLVGGEKRVERDNLPARQSPSGLRRSHYTRALLFRYRLTVSRLPVKEYDVGSNPTAGANQMTKEWVCPSCKQKRKGTHCKDCHEKAPA